jgi:hypothetical protein
MLTGGKDWVKKPLEITDAVIISVKISDNPRKIDKNDMHPI